MICVNEWNRYHDKDIIEYNLSKLLVNIIIPSYTTVMITTKRVVVAVNEK